MSSTHLLRQIRSELQCGQWPVCDEQLDWSVQCPASDQSSGDQCVNTNAYLQLFARPMADLELGDCSQDFQRHVCDLPGMVLVGLRQTTCHHVRVANRLHLQYGIHSPVSFRVNNYVKPAVYL